MSEIYPVPTDMKARTLIDEATYESMYQRSIADPDGFWSEQAKRSSLAEAMADC